MFQEGQAVECVDEKMEGIGPALTKGRKYTVKEFIPSDKCRTLFADNPAQWHNEGGRMELQEEPGCYWFGRRFEVR